jgi:hypothetical protein
MKSWHSILIMVVLFLVGIAIYTVGSYVSAHNYSNKSEVGISTARKNNMNILGQYTTQIAEMVQVPTMMKDDLKEVIQAAIGGRYGAEGSKATWQWIKEHNPSVDPTLYQNIQQAIEAGRNKFENAQTALLSRCQEYETQRGYLIRGIWIRVAGFPKINVDKFCTPIISTHAKESFETGIDDGVKLR